MDIFIINDIANDIRRINGVVISNIFRTSNQTNPLREAAFTELMICLNDLLQKAKAFGVPVTFTDDVPADLPVKGGGVPNITDYVAFIRNTVCHIPSENRMLANDENFQIKITFGIIYGKTPPLFHIAGTPMIEAKYGDDFCFQYGKYLIYFFHQIAKAFEDVKQNLLPILPDNIRKTIPKTEIVFPNDPLYSKLVNQIKE